MGNLISNDPIYYLEKIAETLGAGTNATKAYIFLESNTVQAISTDTVNPTVLDNWTVIKSNGLSLQGDSVRNDTGRTIAALSGTIGFHPQVDGAGGSRLLNLTSENSPDGITYSLNDQNRPIFTTNNSETYATKESYLTDYLSGEYVRLIGHSDNTLSIAPSTASFRGQTISGPAMLWILVEA